MANFTKTNTLDFTSGGDTVYEGCDKLEDNIDDIITDLLSLKKTWAGASAPSSPALVEGQLYYDSTNDNTQVYDGSAWKIIHRGYKTLWISRPDLHAYSGASPGGATYSSSNQKRAFDYWAFDDGSEEYVWANVVMPEDWDLGTVKAKFYWFPATGCTAGDTVEWEIGGIATGNDEVLDTAIGTAKTISDTVLAGVEADLHISGATAAITIGGTPANGDLVSFLISRNVSGTDDMEEDAWLIGVRIQYKVTEIVSAW